MNLFDTKGEKLFINSDGWKKAIKMATDAVRDKSIGIPSSEQRNGGQMDYFKEIAGRSTEPFYLLKPKLGTNSSGFWGDSKREIQ